MKGIKMMYLDKKLEAYANDDYYPFHMPGHKRRALEFFNPYQIDITEIEGFDNLHHAEDILREAQKRAAELYHSKETFYLVNGSTCGILAAMCSCVKSGDKILMARNSHKAAYHGAFLHQLQIQYIYPQMTQYGIQGSIAPEAIEEAFAESPDIQAVFITSPTYDGVTSDIRAIAEIAHRHHVPLIVDEAHGAHFAFSEEFPTSAVECGADIVIQSLHKTLPSFTQTALLHLNSDMVSARDVKKYLGIFETSSPSYLFMAGMEKCIQMLREDKEKLFSEYVERLERFYAANRDLKNLMILEKEEVKEHEDAIFEWDFGKILIFTRSNLLTGEELYRILLKKYHLQMEMCTGSYVTAMTSIMDTEEGFERLTEALHQIDKNLGDSVNSDWQSEFISQTYQPRRKGLEIYQAEALPHREMELQQTEGLMAGEYVYLYPPGIPLVVPGEVIDEQLLSSIRQCKALGLKVEGMEDPACQTIQVVNF